VSGLDHVGLTVQDLDRSIQFYCRVLHCVVQQRSVINGAEVETLTGVPGAVIHTADLKLPSGGMLELLQYLVPVRTVLAQRRFDAGHSHIAFTVDDVEATRTRALSAGAPDCSLPVTLHEPGSSWDRVRVCYALDPDGRTIEFVERPAPRVEPPAPIEPPASDAR
jgi:catechol 2,3-dioxygenase-like lactoylglutathione lyase family enzyme